MTIGISETAMMTMMTLSICLVIGGYTLPSVNPSSVMLSDQPMPPKTLKLMKRR
jgi:hypothetical protein